VDIEKTIKAPMDTDPDWLKKCLMAGLESLIPFCGLGWSKRCFLSVRDGDGRFPDAFEDIGKDLGEGLKVFVRLLPLVVPVILLVILGFILPFVLYRIPFLPVWWFGRILGWVLHLGAAGAALAIAVASPAVLYRAFADKECLSVQAYKDMYQEIRTHSSEYIHLWIIWIVGRFIGGLGGIACGIGQIVTAPYGIAVSVRGMVEWGKVVK
jgi:hypothetical protein